MKIEMQTEAYLQNNPAEWLYGLRERPKPNACSMSFEQIMQIVNSEILTENAQASRIRDWN
jgi:hypothetical protein